MVLEASVALFASWRARSPALLAFGGDSAIELASALVVLWTFRSGAKPRASQISGGLLFVLAAYVATVSVASLLGYGEPRPTLLGMAILGAAAILMPWLAREKRKLSATTGSSALRADATQSGVCAYLAVIALAGLAANRIWHAHRADPVAALVIVPLVLWEGREAIRGKPCGCH